jgi:hypothetical protein
MDREGPLACQQRCRGWVGLDAAVAAWLDHARTLRETNYLRRAVVVGICLALSCDD